MSMTTFDATPKKPDASLKGQESQNSALAQALSGELYSSKESAFGSFAKAGTVALQQTLDKSAQDMETKGQIPEREKVADLTKATHDDKHGDFVSRLASDDIVDNAQAKALKNV